LSGKVDKKEFANRYKEVREKQNFVKRKRKMDLMENSINNPKE
jgi:hypothetical protein